jgi:hypothetical protein
MTDKRFATGRCKVVIYPASRERNNAPHWPYARHCLRPARIDGFCIQHARMPVITSTMYREACPK